MKKTLRASVMVLAFCVPALAGDMLTPPVAPPPPATAVQGPTTQGVIDAPMTTNGYMPNGAAVTFVEVLLNLLALS